MSLTDHSKCWSGAAALCVALCVPGLALRPADAKAAKAPLPVQAPAVKPVAKPDKAPALEDEPDVWTASEIEDAKRFCAQVLKKMDAEYRELPPIKKDRCGAPAPIRLISIGKEDQVTFNPAPTLTCQMLEPLQRWIEEGLQPLAQRHLNDRVASISVMSSYACRTRYGRKGAKMSEHAFANAIDIGGFRLAGRQRVKVLKHWGATERDLEKAIATEKANEREEAQRRSAEKVATIDPAKAAPADAGQGTRARASGRRGRRPLKRPVDAGGGRRGKAYVRVEPLRTQRINPTVTTRARASTGGPVPLPGRPPARALLRESGIATPPLPTRRPLRQAVRAPRTGPTQSAAPLTGTNSATGTKRRYSPPYRLGAAKPADKQPRALFLRGAHESACKIFGTTLGPEANEAHRNHFHLDMFPRRRGGYCE